MKNTKKTKKQLLKELESTQVKIAELENDIRLREQQRLTRKEQLFLEIINRAPFSIWASKGKQGNYEVVLWNQGAAEIYRQSEKEVVGSNYLHLFVSQEEREQSALDCDQIITNGEVFRNFLAQDKAKDGSIRQMLTNCFRIWDEVDQGYLQAEIGLDITEGEFFRAERKLRTIREVGIYQNVGQTLRQIQNLGRGSNLQNVLQGILDMTREYLPGSQSFVYLYDSKKGALDLSPIVSSSVEIMTSSMALPELPKTILAKLDGSKKKSGRGMSLINDNPALYQEENKVWYELSLGSRILGFFVITLPDSAPLSSEKEVAIVTAADIVAVAIIIHTLIAESQQKAAENEKLAGQLRERFGDIAHQLRSPITEMKGFTQLIANGRVTNPEIQKEYFTIILAAIEGFETRINDMLNLKKIEAGQLKFSKHPVSIKRLIEKVIRLYKYSIEINKLTITMDLNHSQDIILADEEGLKSALQVLVENAIHYSPEGSTIIISTMNDIGALFISVTDNGIGISPQEIDKIFEKYYRSEKAIKDRPEGTGIGLTIAKYIITEGHGGKISVMSKPGHGSTFTVLLPIS